MAGMEVSGGDLGELFDMSARWVQKLAASGVFVRLRPGRFALKDSVLGYVRHVQELAGQGKLPRNLLEEGETASPGELLKEKIRLTRAQADAKEMEASVMAGELLDRECLQEEWGRLVSSFRARVLSVPSKLAGRLQGVRDPRQIEAMLKETLYEALRELSNYDPDRVAAKSAEKRRLVGGAAPESDAERMGG
jgi:phage terminase Nu1 subunit (DNA packaging protein)